MRTTKTPSSVTGTPENSHHDRVEVRASREKLHLWSRIASGSRISLWPWDLYKTATHLWSIFQDFWWLWEIVAILASFTSMAAAAIILALVNGMDLADWAFPIQPNSLISIFITVSRSALMAAVAGAMAQSKWMQYAKPTRLIQLQKIDEAGQGPWGSAQLLADLLKHRGKAFNGIATVGAILTIVSLALDPFAQQIIAYPSRLIYSTQGNATFETNRIFIDIDMVPVQGALLGGVYGRPQSTNYTCNSSNCRWPTMTTLGICSICTNLTSQARAACNTTPGPRKPAETDAWTFDTTACNYTVAENISLSAYIQTVSFPAADGRAAEYSSQWTQMKLVPFGGNYNNSPKEALGELILPNTYWFSTYLAYITSFDSSTNPLPLVSPSLLAPELLGCGIFPCGQIWENLTLTDGSLVTDRPSSYRATQVVLNAQGERWYHTVNRSDYSDILQVHGDGFPGNGTYEVSETTADNLTLYLNTMFDLMSTGGNDQFSDFPEAAKGLFGLDQALARGGGLQSSFDRAARGLSEYVRHRDTSTIVTGSALVQETFIQVRWEWLTLPLLVVAAASVLLFTTIVVNHYRAVRVWKSSSLALLLHEVEGRDELERLRSGDIHGMNRKAEKVNVHLAGGSSGFKFVVDS
ncbi:hypothetical protein GQ53DRAFT_819688 [Thozetella sp. PMI_491]|nr:hypothetical protein GQ53DRAFT_819688 [Thozetella sp. PMI_491]